MRRCGFWQRRSSKLCERSEPKSLKSGQNNGLISDSSLALTRDLLAGHRCGRITAEQSSFAELDSFDEGDESVNYLWLLEWSLVHRL